ncbi:tRNA pseudouridine(38-40) synthase TruA [candidate division WOR-3 bacterium]|nr:tRNA pseudouridine(38-40) synthase TruA [candidate division WOR-3 bacterium]
MTVEYDGADFYGWQVQPDKVTVQGKIEEALAQITGKDIRVKGAGRTDAGVHAAGQVATLDYEGKLSLEKLAEALNSVLPESVFIKELIKVSPAFDVRADCLYKLYVYRIVTGKSPLRRRTFWEYPYPLDISRMQVAARALEGTHDYAALCEVDGKSPEITVDSVEVEQHRDEITIRVGGKGFLYKMVRRMAGIIADCGRGKITPEMIESLFSRNKPVQTVTAPAHGLTLEVIKY